MILRNIMINSGRVVDLSDYSKMEAVTHKPNIIARFLTESAGDLVLLVEGINLN
jgi:hypothetical protein